MSHLKAVFCCQGQKLRLSLSGDDIFCCLHIIFPDQIAISVGMLLFLGTKDSGDALSGFREPFQVLNVLITAYLESILSPHEYTHLKIRIQIRGRCHQKDPDQRLMSSRRLLLVYCFFCGPTGSVLELAAWSQM